MESLQKKIGITGLTISQLTKRAALLKMKLQHVIPGGEAEKRYRAELTKIQTRLGTLSTRAKTAKFSISSLAQGFNKYAALGASVLAMGTGVAISLQKMIDYNGKLSDSQADVMKTTGMTKKEVDELTSSLGMLQTRTSRVNLLKIAEEGGRIGIAKEEIGEFVKVMNKANVALGDSFTGGVEEVASKLGKLKLLFKETKNQKVDEAYNGIGSAINELGANGVATEVNIANFATRVGSLPDAIKPSINDALALGAAFEESGIQSEIAGRGYNIFLKQASSNSSKFAKVMGVTTQEVENMINTNPTEFFLEFSAGLKGMNATETANTLKYLGLNAEGTNKIVGAAGNNINRFRELLELSTTSMAKATSLTDEYNIKNNNLAAILDKIKKKTLGWFSSDGLVSWLTAAAQGFAKLIGATEDSTKALKDEQTELFVLESKIKDVNTKNEDRVKLINQLKEKYPGLLGYIDADKISNKELSKALRLVNDELINKIILEEKDAEILDQVNSIAKAKEGLVNSEAKARRFLAEAAANENVIIKEGVGLTQQLADAYEQVNKGKSITEKDQSLNTVRKQLLFNQKNYNKALEEGNLLETKRNELASQLGIKTSIDEPTEEPTPKIKEGDTKVIGGITFIFKNGAWTPVQTFTPTGGDGDDDDEEMTPEDKAILASKEKLAGFIAAIDEDMGVQNELKKLQAEEKEVLALENKYLKMAEDAGFETVVAAGLEDAKQAEIDAVREKWEGKRIKDKIANDKKYEAQDKKAKKALEQAEINLKNAKAAILSAGVSFLGDIFGQSSAIYKVMFGLEKALAISQIITSTAKANALAVAANAAVPSIIPPGLPNPMKAISVATMTKSILANKLSAVASIATIAGSAIKGFEDGLYPITREQDGKNFNAAYGGPTTSGEVNKPTLFLAGEQGAAYPELIIDGDAYKKMNPDIKYAVHREIARVKGFQQGMYPDNVTTPSTQINTSEVSDQLLTMFINVVNENNEVMKDLRDNGVVAVMSKNLKNAKSIQEAISDYNTLRNKNKI